MKQIADKGWCVWDDFLTPEAVKQLRACFGNDAQQARIGRHENLLAETTIRSDKIRWLEPANGRASSTLSYANGKHSTSS
ncbi:2-oxoglutarate and Fe(II)-dependent oxygenase superfamily protein [Proteus mirabilis]|uniref:2-oxoglutarate and Fe(II)-dependent oxygenase superfamily protein n=1 Tax=Proteus mirabilis TaxID=584 RepID=A0A2X2DKX0_PROMI|nr:2-oxoglutarate and Fe(II)-dependent oxygenase superfamily protein [Proteus mirabilis]